MKYCSLFSGSSGNSQYIKVNNTAILIDCGMSGKKIANAVNSVGENLDDVKAIFVTHEHSDHIQAAGIMSRRLKIPIYATEGTWGAMEKSIGKIAPENIQIIESGIGNEIDDLFVESFDISHDAAQPVGFKMFHADKKISVMTDTGYVSDAMKMHLKNSDLIMIESNHDEDMLMVGPYPPTLKKRVLGKKGHLSNNIAGDTLAELLHKGNEIVLLGHLSEDNNIPMLAYKTVAEILENKGIKMEFDVKLNLTFRERSTKVFEV